MILGPRRLNRALLARQHLLGRVDRPALAVVADLVGMQAQVPTSPDVGLWSRMRGFDPAELSAAMLGRRAVRLVAMRSTIHLMTSEDALALRPVLQDVQERNLRQAGRWWRLLGGVDVGAVVARGRELLERDALTPVELGEKLRERWPDADRDALAMACRNHLALVQVPPRGVWGRGGATRLTTLEAWTGRDQASDRSPDGWVLRYLAAFGPASIQDAQAWSGLTRLSEAFERLRPRLVVHRTDDGRELFDLPDAPLPDEDTPSPPRLLAEYDNVTLSHADRARIVSDEDRRRIATKNGVGSAAFLLDGRVAGTWHVATGKAEASLEIAPLRELADDDAEGLEREGRELLAFLEPKAEGRVWFSGRHRG